MDENTGPGSKVKVTCSNGDVRTNVVWEVGENLVYLCSERQYEALRSGHDAPPPVGFPKRDICKE